MRRASPSIAANPVLIGAATTLVVLVAVFLAYNANNGLPFVPTYSLTADVPSAANLVPGNEIRIGGTRVGVVEEITPKRLASGQVIAQLHLKLETAVKPLPVDSTILVRSRSALGLKYVELTKGTSTKGYDEDATIPLKAATPAPVEFDEFLSTFDEKTRTAAQKQLEGFGNAFAGRGQDLNQAIQSLNPLLLALGPAMANLADDRTKLGRLSEALGRTAAIVAPVAEDQAALFRNLDTTFSAFAAIARPYLQDSISGGPPALQTAIEELPKQRPFLANSEGLFRDLRPGVKALSGAASDLSDAFTVGEPALRHSVAFNKRLVPTFASAAALRRGPAGRAGRPGPRRHRADRQPAAGDARADPDGLQLLDPVLPQRRLAAERGRQQRHGPALHDRRLAPGPQQRGQPVVGAGQRADRRQLPAQQPLPEHRGAGADAGVRGRQRGLRARQADHRQRRGQPGQDHAEDGHLQRHAQP